MFYFWEKDDIEEAEERLLSFYYSACNLKLLIGTATELRKIDSQIFTIADIIFLVKLRIMNTKTVQVIVISIIVLFLMSGHIQEWIFKKSEEAKQVSQNVKKEDVDKNSENEEYLGCDRDLVKKDEENKSITNQKISFPKNHYITNNNNQIIINQANPQQKNISLSLNDRNTNKQNIKGLFEKELNNGFNNDINLQFRFDDFDEGVGGPTEKLPLVNVYSWNNLNLHDFQCGKDDTSYENFERGSLNNRSKRNISESFHAMRNDTILTNDIDIFYKDNPELKLQNCFPQLPLGNQKIPNNLVRTDPYYWAQKNMYQMMSPRNHNGNMRKSDGNHYVKHHVKNPSRFAKLYSNNYNEGFGFGKLDCSGDMTPQSISDQLSNPSFIKIKNLKTLKTLDFKLEGDKHPPRPVFQARLHNKLTNQVDDKEEHSFTQNSCMRKNSNHDSIQPVQDYKYKIEDDIISNPLTSIDPKLVTSVRAQNQVGYFTPRNHTVSHGTDQHQKYAGHTRNDVMNRSSYLFYDVLRLIDNGLMLFDSNFTCIYDNIKIYCRKIENTKVTELMNIDLFNHPKPPKLEKLFKNVTDACLIMDCLYFTRQAKIYSYVKADRNIDIHLPKIEDAMTSISMKEQKGLVNMGTQNFFSSKDMHNRSDINENIIQNNNQIIEVYIHELLELLKVLFMKIEIEKNKKTEYIEYEFLKLCTLQNFFYKDLSINISFVDLLTEPVICIVFNDLGDKLRQFNYDDKNQFKNRLLSSIDHEIRTPLNLIFCLVENWTEEFKEAEDMLSNIGMCNYDQIDQNDGLRINSMVVGNSINKSQINDLTLKSIKGKTYIKSNMMEINSDVENVRELLNTCRQESVNIIKSQTHLLLILQSWVDFAMLETKKFSQNISDVNIKACIMDIFDIYREQLFERNIDYNLSIEDDCKHSFKTDETRLKIILSNIIFNSIKYTINGKIDIHVERINSGIIRFVIIDSGIGMSHETLVKLKDSLKDNLTSTITENSSGIGLGLRVCSSLQKHLGTKGFNNIDIDSEKDHGTCISFYLKTLEENEQEFVNLRFGYEDQEELEKMMVISSMCEIVNKVQRSDSSIALHLDHYSSRGEIDKRQALSFSNGFSDLTPARNQQEMNDIVRNFGKLQVNSNSEKTNSKISAFKRISPQYFTPPPQFDGKNLMEFQLDKSDPFIAKKVSLQELVVTNQQKNLTRNMSLDNNDTSKRMKLSNSNFGSVKLPNPVKRSGSTNEENEQYNLFEIPECQSDDANDENNLNSLNNLNVRTLKSETDNYFGNSTILSTPKQGYIPNSTEGSHGKQTAQENPQSLWRSRLSRLSEKSEDDVNNSESITIPYDRNCQKNKGKQKTENLGSEVRNISDKELSQSNIVQPLNPSETLTNKKDLKNSLLLETEDLGDRNDPPVKALSLNINEKLDESNVECDCKNLMIVDDEVFNIKIMEKLLKDLTDWNFYQALNGQLAYDLYKKKFETNPCRKCSFFRFILCDLNMPVMDGAQCSKNIIEFTEKELVTKGINSKDFQSTVIIAVSAYTDRDSRDYCLNSGMKVYLNKPVKKHVLISNLRSLKFISDDKG